jgi:ABC-type Fe3+ transport system permease subunit
MTKGIFCWLFCLAVLVVAVASPSVLLAQGSVDAEPLVDFSGVFDSLKDTVTAVVVGAVGIGIAIWATRYVFSVVRSMGRG